MAITQSPTRVVVLSPNLTKGRPLALIFRTARSDATSRPINFASYSLRLGRMTVMLSTTAVAVPPDTTWARSEEHTSELQSLMRISYAVFCLQKKKQLQHINSIHTYITQLHNLTIL